MRTLSTTAPTAWRSLPRTTQIVLLSLTLAGMGMLGGGLWLDSAGWTTSHPFANNIYSAAVGFCFAIPTAILVLKHLDDARDRRAIHIQTVVAWDGFVDAVRAYLATASHAELLSDAQLLYDSSVRTLQRRTASRAVIRIQRDWAEQLGTQWQRVIEHAADNQAWGRVLASWEMLNSHIRPRRIDTALPWFPAEDYQAIKWAIQFGSARAVAEEGVGAARDITYWCETALARLTNHDAAVPAVVGATATDRQTPTETAPRRDGGRRPPLVHRTGYDANTPDEILCALSWRQRAESAMRQRDILQRVIDQTDLETFTLVAPAEGV